MSLTTVIFMGRPGSGKGTQANFLVERYGFEYFGTGVTFRKLLTEDTPLGHLVAEVDREGLLQPHWFGSYIVTDKILNTSPDTQLVIDGSNRTLPEAELFYEQMQWLKREYRVVYLDVSEADILARLTARGSESGRADDSPEKLANRVREYDTKTNAAREFIKSKGLLIEISGNRPPEEIHNDVVRALGL